MNTKGLADNIDIFTEQFEAHLKKHGAYDKVCDFKEGTDCRTEELNICETPACHGGEIAIMYDEMRVLYEDSYRCFFEEGAHMLAKNLGFKSCEDLIYFFGSHPQYWGALDSEFMFEPEGELAFGKDKGEEVTLREILEWWEAIPARLRMEGTVNETNDTHN